MKDIRYVGDIKYELASPGFVSVVRNKSFVFSYKNGKPTFSFIFVQRGRLEYVFTKTNEVVQIEKDGVLFIPKHYPYITTYLNDNTKIQILNFDFQCQDIPKEFSKPVYQNRSELSLIFNSISVQNMTNPLFLTSKIYELLYHFEKENVTISKKYQRLIPAIKELQQFYFKNEKISYYATLSNMSEPNFRKLFKEYTGKSPIEYRNLIRVLNVKRLLSSGEFKITESAYLVGFNNMAFFYETYKKYK